MTIDLAQVKRRYSPVEWRANVARLQAERLGLDPVEWVSRAVLADHDDAPAALLRSPRPGARSHLTEAQIRRLALDILALATPHRADSSAPGDADALDLEPGRPTQAVGVDESLQSTGLDDGLAPEPEHRGLQAVSLLRKIVRQNPDAALALSTVKRLAATDWSLRVYRIGPDGPTDIEDTEATAEARRFLARVMRSHEGGGVPAMLSVGLDSLVTDGAVAFELDVAPSLDDVRDVVPVDPTLVRWQTTTTPGGQRVLRPVFKPSTGEPKPFNLHQFCYSGLDTTVTDPHGRPWILPVLDTAPAQHKLRNTLHKVMVHQGYGRLAAKVDYDKVAESMPASARTPDEKRAYMRRVLGDITDRLKKLKPDDAVALYDFITLEVLGAGHGTHSLKTQETTDIYDTDNAAALKTPPSILGRSVGVSLSTNSDIHWWVYALSVEALREHVVRVVEWAVSQYLRIRGHAAYAVITFEPIQKTDAASDEEAALAKQERLLAARDAGLVDDDYVRTEMGYPEPAGARRQAAPAPTRAPARVGAAPSPAEAHSPTLRQPADDAAPRTAPATTALIATLVVSCTKCGAANLRRPGGHGRCRKCGAYLCARRAAVEEPEPDLEAVAVDVAHAAEAAGLPPKAARAHLEAYADTVATLGLDGETHCASCGEDTCTGHGADPTRTAAKFQPAKPAAAGAVELGQDYALPDEDDGEEAAEAWRAWAEEHAPDLAKLPFAELYEEEDEDDEEEDRGVGHRVGGQNLRRDDAQAKGWMWDPRILAYREAADPERVLSEATIRRAYERRMADHRGAIARLTDRLEAGDISVADWQRGIAASLKETHLQLRMLAVGGRDRMTQRHYGSVGGFIRADTDRLARFGQQVAKGDLTMTQIRARAALYGQANLRREYERGREWAALDSGYLLERRVLKPGADHCKGCYQEAQLGWVRIGSLAPIGGHECAANDQCHKEYRFTAKEPVKPTANGSGARSAGGDRDAGRLGRAPASTMAVNGAHAGVGR